MYACIPHTYYFPVEPNPPTPRTVSLSSATSSNSTLKNGTTTKDGKEVNYSKYDDGSTTYYKGNTILMSESADGTVIYYDSVINSAPSGFFAPPAGYTSKPLNAANIKEFSNLIGGTQGE